MSRVFAASCCLGNLPTRIVSSSIVQAGGGLDDLGHFHVVFYASMACNIGMARCIEIHLPEKYHAFHKFCNHVLLGTLSTAEKRGRPAFHRWANRPGHYYCLHIGFFHIFPLDPLTQPSAPSGPSDQTPGLLRDETWLQTLVDGIPPWNISLWIQSPSEKVRLTPERHHTPVTLPKKVRLDP